MSKPSIEPRNKRATSECRHGPNAQKTTSWCSFWQERQELGGVEDLGMPTRIRCSQSGEPGCIGHGAIHSGGAVQHQSRRKGRYRTPTMNAPRQSDRCVGVAKSPNKSVQAETEG